MEETVVINGNFKVEQDIAVLTAAEHNIRMALDQVSSLEDPRFDPIVNNLVDASEHAIATLEMLRAA
jgi:hypothetical protein